MKKNYVSQKEHMAEFSKDKAAVRELLSQSVFEEPAVFRLVLKDLIEATGGVGALSEKSGLSRVAIYEMISEKGNPRFSSISKVVRAFNLTPA